MAMRYSVRYSNQVLSESTTVTYPNGIDMTYETPLEFAQLRRICIEMGVCFEQDSDTNFVSYYYEGSFATGNQHSPDWHKVSKALEKIGAKEGDIESPSSIFNHTPTSRPFP